MLFLLTSPSNLAEYECDNILHLWSILKMYVIIILIFIVIQGVPFLSLVYMEWLVCHVLNKEFLWLFCLLTSILSDKKANQQMKRATRGLSWKGSIPQKQENVIFSKFLLPLLLGYLIESVNKTFLGMYSYHYFSQKKLVCRQLRSLVLEASLIPNYLLP